MRTGLVARDYGLWSLRSGADRYARFILQVKAREEDRSRPTEIADRVRSLRAQMARQGLKDNLVVDAFALIRQVCARELGLALFPSQLMAGRIMLDNRLAEMATGEGKTLAAALCGATAALAGIPVHVITANDYLVMRDAQLLEPLYRALNLRVSSVTQQMNAEARRHAYDADIVYCTASEIVFDYLRDGLVRRRSLRALPQQAATPGRPDSRRTTLLRGLCMAIVDEADSILIDDARIPLVLSEACLNGAELDYLSIALKLAEQLVADRDFVLDRQNLSVDLTTHGRQTLETMAADLLGAWRNRLHREETVRTALLAIHLYAKDRHYLVRDGAVSIVDEATGRVAPGRVWSRGLHQLIELKEGCSASGSAVTVAQITYQRFFQRYLALTGMSGTLREARAELHSIYGVRTVAVSLYWPNRRSLLPTRIYPDRESQRSAAVVAAATISRGGRPVLIGTDSVAESEALSQRLRAAGLTHGVLNARQDREEAQVIARAGQAASITVTTNMAGRGTDIALGTGVSALGGLHVICCQHNASRRIDRQLLGRCARRGDPGSAQTLLALEQPLIARWVPRWLASRIDKDGCDRPQWIARALLRIPQWLEERRQRMQRKALLERDLGADYLQSSGQFSDLSFGQPSE